MRANNILETIGNTSHVRINHLFGSDYEVWCKLERENPGGSIKDRIAKAMIEDAEKSGILKSDSVIIEPTSGNTGIGLAMVCAVKKYRLILVMPESFSVERRKIMVSYGAEIVLTPREKGMKGAIEKAGELVAADHKAWMPMQFENVSNVFGYSFTNVVNVRILKNMVFECLYMVTNKYNLGRCKFILHKLR